MTSFAGSLVDRQSDAALWFLSPLRGDSACVRGFGDSFTSMAPVAPGRARARLTRLRGAQGPWFPRRLRSRRAAASRLGRQCIQTGEKTAQTNDRVIKMKT